jgi:hypothetical protein
MQPFEKRWPREAYIGGVHQGAHGDRLYDGEQVLATMGQLVEEQTLALLETLAFGNVDGGGNGTGDPTVRLTNARCTRKERKPLPIFEFDLELLVVNAFAPAHEVVSHVEVVIGNEDSELMVSGLGDSRDVANVLSQT